MEIAKLDTLEVLNEFEFRQLHSGMMFPADLPPDVLLELGYVIVTYDPQPELAEGEQLEYGDLRKKGKKVIRGWTVIPVPPPDWPALIADRRWAAEVAGVDITGIHVDTDDRSKLLINGAALEAMIDPGYVMKWKTLSGFVELQAAQVLAVARAVRAHVQACFDREAVLLDAVANGTITADMIEESWPG